MITAELDTTDYNKALEKQRAREEAEYKKVLRKGAVTLATFAVRYTPPGQFNLQKKKAAELRENDKYWAEFSKTVGMSSRDFSGDQIPSHLYKRKYLHVPTLLKTTDNGSFRTWLRGEYERGIRYVVRFNPRGQAVQWIGYRSWAAAKQAVPIRRRGLAKAAWGLNLGSLGQRVPKNIQGLVKKAPALAGEAGKNKFLETYRDGVFALDVINQGLAGSIPDRLERMIRTGAEKKAMMKIDREIDKLRKKEVIL